jgi:hypothetical protein
VRASPPSIENESSLSLMGGVGVGALGEMMKGLGNAMTK